MKSKKVSKKDFGESWPFKVPSGEIKSDGKIIIFEHNLKKYALNGIALQAGYKDIEPIWLEDKSIPVQPDCPPVRKNIGEMINIGLFL